MKEEMVEKPASKSPQGTELEQGSQHVFKSMGVEKMGFKRKSMTSFQTQWTGFVTKGEKGTLALVPYD